MKKVSKIFILPLIACFLLVFCNNIEVQAKGSSFSSGGSRSSVSSSSSRSSSFSSSSSKSSSSSSTSKPSSSSNSSSKPSSSSGSASGFKSGSYSSSSSTSKPSSSSGSSSSTKSSWFSSSSKSVNTSSPALRSIPPTYSSRSISNNYYYNSGGSGFDSFLGHYLLFRALEPDHRTYVNTSGATVVAPAYTGFSSVMWDVLTLIIVILIIALIVWGINKRKRWW